MRRLSIAYWVLSAIALLALCSPAIAGSKAPEEAARLLDHQLKAVKEKDYQAFLKYANKAFREIYSDFSFDSLCLMNSGKLSKKYNTQYLGMIKKIGMDIHLFKLTIEGEKSELLVRLTLSRYMVVGFDIE